ncbi:hypothetical protein [Marivita sp. S2033]|uniref:hypothetical protein n=1 Tax=Marivita sp. S2033 TaxID=3373187 RepID=UPI003982C634
MLALGRLVVIGFLVLTVVYFSLSFYCRAGRREELEKEWDEEIRAGNRDTYVQGGLREYDGSLRRKLLLGVYIVPLTLMCAVIYFTNFY